MQESEEQLCNGMMQGALDVMQCHAIKRKDKTGKHLLSNKATQLIKETVCC